MYTETDITIEIALPEKDDIFGVDRTTTYLRFEIDPAAATGDLWIEELGRGERPLPLGHDICMSTDERLLVSEAGLRQVAADLRNLAADYLNALRRCAPGGELEIIRTVMRDQMSAEKWISRRVIASDIDDLTGGLRTQGEIEIEASTTDEDLVQIAEAEIAFWDNVPLQHDEMVGELIEMYAEIRDDLREQEEEEEDEEEDLEFA